jgi:hypothetical protein
MIITSEDPTNHSKFSLETKTAKEKNKIHLTKTMKL